VSTVHDLTRPEIYKGLKSFARRKVLLAIMKFLLKCQHFTLNIEVTFPLIDNFFTKIIVWFREKISTIRKDHSHTSNNFYKILAKI